jgi:hypothetical protein
MLTVAPGGPWRWMDLHGRAQPGGRANTQTRGVVDRNGHRVWLDVFPDATGL